MSAASGGRRRAAVVIVVLAVVLVAWLVPWKAIRYGRVEPPAVATAELEPLLARRVEDATAAVRRDLYAGDAWGRLAGVYDVHNLTAEAATCYERAQTLDPENFRWPYLLGRVTLTGDQARSLAHYRRAAELDDGYAPVQVHIARALLLQGAVDEAETHFARALALDPTLVRPHIGLGQVALARADAAAALEHLREAQRLGAASREVHLLLADALERQGAAEAAAGHTRAAEAATVDREPLPDPLRSELVAQEGVTMGFRVARTQQLLRAGRVDVALAEWEAALREAPDSAAAHAEYALVLTQAQRLDDAIIELQQALALDPELHRARNNLGTLLLRKGRTEEGVAELRTSCAAMPDDAAAHLNLAMALRAIDRYPEAVAAFAQVLAIEPGNIRARFESGLTLAASERFEEAVAAFRLVIAAEPKRRSAYVNLALACDRLGLHEEAADALRDGLGQLPGDRQLGNSLAWRLATVPVDSARDGEEALAVIRPLCEASGYQDARQLDSLAAALAETGDFDGAVRYIEQAIELTRTAPSQEAPEVRERAVEALESRRDLYREGRPYRQGE